MGVVYFKRFRMEMDLARLAPLPPPVPAGYLWLPWDAALVGVHAETKFRSFATELDANVFPCLAARDGCKRLMQEISRREGFLPQATWLLVLRRGEPAGTKDAGYEFCGTVQGVRDGEYGAIQNLGITPEHRGHGLGTCLLHRALDGFRQAGLERAYLEVTARNAGAIRLYERFGFRKVRTVYKAAELAAC